MKMKVSSKPSGDLALLKRYARGDTQALEALVERYRRPLFGFVLGMTGNPHEAEEVFQEVWFRVIRKVGSYRHKNFCGWLMRIAHNLVIDRARRRKPVISVDGSPDEDGPRGIDLPSKGLSPARETQAGELGERIQAAVNTLPAEQKEVFLMRTQLEMSFRDIATAQKTSINTALARMHYALGKLRQVLREEYKDWQEPRDGAGM